MAETSGLDAAICPVVVTPVGAGAYIFDLEVDPAHRRMGHAARALEHVIAWARLEGFLTVGLSVFDHNPGARGLYEVPASPWSVPAPARRRCCSSCDTAQEIVIPLPYRDQRMPGVPLGPAGGGMPGIHQPRGVEEDGMPGRRKGSGQWKPARRRSYRWCSTVRDRWRRSPITSSGDSTSSWPAGGPRPARPGSRSPSSIRSAPSRS